MNKDRRRDTRVVIALVLAGIFAGYAAVCGVEYRAAVAKEAEWNGRMGRELPVGISRSEVELVLTRWGVSSMWHDKDRQLSASIGVRVRKFFVDYGLGVVLSFDASDRLIRAEIQRVYSARI